MMAYMQRPYGPPPGGFLVPAGPRPGALGAAGSPYGGAGMMYAPPPHGMQGVPRPMYPHPGALAALPMLQTTRNLHAGHHATLTEGCACMH